MLYAPCPVCVLKHVGTVSAPECPVCAGEARITINERMALTQGLDAWPDKDRCYHGTVPHDRAKRMGAEIIACSLWLALARCAKDTASLDDEQRLDALSVVVEHFHTARLLGADMDDVSRETHTTNEDSEVYAQLSEPHAGRTFTRLPHGTPPVKSEAGHPSTLARLVDPYQIDIFPGERENTHRRNWFNADVLGQAVDRVAGTWSTKITGGTVA